MMGGQSCKYLTQTEALLVKFYSGQSTCKENIVHQVKVKNLVTSVSSESGTGWTQIFIAGLDENISMTCVLLLWTSSRDMHEHFGVQWHNKKKKERRLVSLTGTVLFICSIFSLACKALCTDKAVITWC